ncbi:hypothetical protein ACLX1H_009769 [Fusarium chlamydosporum]
MAQLPERPVSGAKSLEYPEHIPDPEGLAIIPSLPNPAPAIFRPIGTDEVLSDITSTTRLDRLQAELESLNAHVTSTNENFLALCIREHERILQDGRRWEALEKMEGFIPENIPRGVEPIHLDSMIANMEAKPPGDLYQDTPQIPQPAFDMKDCRSLRERQAFLMMDF